MPQTTKIVTPEQAKRWYGFIVDPALPFKQIITTRRFIVEKKEGEYSQSITIKPNPEYEEPLQEQESHKNGDLF
jgi:hypothetical protein